VQISVGRVIVRSISRVTPPSIIPAGAQAPITSMSTLPSAVSNRMIGWVSDRAAHGHLCMRRKRRHWRAALFPRRKSRYETCG